MATISVYSCRALTSPRISGFKPSMKVLNSYFWDQSWVWLDNLSNLVWYSWMVEVCRILSVNILVIGWSEADQQSFFELLPWKDSISMFKLVKPLYSIPFKMYSYNFHHRCIRDFVVPKISLRARDPTNRVSFFPSREVHSHAWIVRVGHRAST